MALALGVKPGEHPCIHEPISLKTTDNPVDTFASALFGMLAEFFFLGGAGREQTHKKKGIRVYTHRAAARVFFFRDECPMATEILSELCIDRS